MPENLIFNGGESPLASKVASAATSLGQTGASQSDAGPAPDLTQPATEPASASPGTAEPPLGGVVRARKS